MPPRHLTWFLGSFLVALMVRPALADTGTQTYSLAGSDAFQIPGRGMHDVLTYSGIERLSFQSLGDATSFHATVTYAKRDGSETAHDGASFALEMSATGDVRNERDRDPDYLTILNQPFSIQLDAPTMRDLHDLERAVPFDFPSPMTGAPLHGSLRRVADGSLNGVRVLGIAFSARGPLHGSLPDRPSMALSGNITMNGTAYYAYANALLLALDATLLIDGKVAGSSGNDAVTIIYKRTIRPLSADPGR